jgi:hypothetical protein
MEAPPPVEAEPLAPPPPLAEPLDVPPPLGAIDATSMEAGEAVAVDAEGAPMMAPPEAPPYAFPVVVAEDPAVRRQALSTWIVLIGVAVLIWGVGAAFSSAAAFQLNAATAGARLERIGLLLAAIGLCLGGLFAIALGVVYRKR